MASLVLGQRGATLGRATGRTTARTTGGLGRLERDARRQEQERLKQRSSNLLGGSGLGQSPTRRAAPLGGLGQ